MWGLQEIRNGNIAATYQSKIRQARIGAKNQEEFIENIKSLGMDAKPTNIVGYAEIKAEGVDIGRYKTPPDKHSIEHPESLKWGWFTSDGNRFL